MVAAKTPLRITVNGVERKVEAAADMPLLWVLRELLGLTGTKYGCGIGVCGSCTVLVDGKAHRSCVIPVGSIGDQIVTTIEGLADGDKLHPVQQAWLDGRVAQCGYCQPAQVLSAVALLTENPNPTSSEIREKMSGVLCRCGTYPRVLAAIERLAGDPSQEEASSSTGES